MGKPVEINEKVRYSDEELQEFKELILESFAQAREEYEMLRGAVNHSKVTIQRTQSPTFKVLEEVRFFPLPRKSRDQLAARQYKFIQNLENAYSHQNKTYGICV